MTEKTGEIIDLPAQPAVPAPVLPVQDLVDALKPALEGIVENKMREFIKLVKQTRHGFGVQRRLLGEAECQRASTIVQQTLEAAGHAGTIKATQDVDTATRDSRIVFANPYTPDEKFGWSDEDKLFMQSILIRMVGVMHITQGSTLRASVPPLSGMPAELMQLTEYTPGQHYAMHQDSDGGNVERRAMSMSLLIDPAEDGGDFRFRDVEIAAPFDAHIRERGSAIVFPSSAFHGISPVTKGVRRSIVLWINSAQVPAEKA